MVTWYTVTMQLPILRNNLLTTYRTYRFKVFPRMRQRDVRFGAESQERQGLDVRRLHNMLGHKPKHVMIHDSDIEECKSKP